MSRIAELNRCLRFAPCVASAVLVSMITLLSPCYANAQTSKTSKTSKTEKERAPVTRKVGHWLLSVRSTNYGEIPKEYALVAEDRELNSAGFSIGYDLNSYASDSSLGLFIAADFADGENDLSLANFSRQDYSAGIQYRRAITAWLFPTARLEAVASRGAVEIITPGESTLSADAWTMGARASLGMTLASRPLIIRGKEVVAFSLSFEGGVLLASELEMSSASFSGPTEPEKGSVPIFNEKVDLGTLPSKMGFFRLVLNSHF